MLSLLYRLFPQAFHKLVFESQKKPVNFSNFNFSFIDSEGRKYYRANAGFDLSINRKARLEQSFMELDSALSHSEILLITAAMKKALNKTDNKGRMTPEISIIGHCITELEERKTKLIHVDILFEIAASINIREDEDPEIYDDEIHKQKVEQFKRDSQGGLAGFFALAKLNECFPFLGNLKDSLEKEMALRYSQARILALKNQLRAYISENE